MLIACSRASVQILDINCPGETFISSFIDPINCEIRTVKIAFSPSLELLLVGNLIYHIDFDECTMASTPLSIPIPSLINDQLDIPSVSCIFSSCNNYLAIAADPSHDLGSSVAFYIYHIARMTKVISNIEIPNLQLKDCAGLKIDFHPTKPYLAIGCWTNQQNEDRKKRWSRVRCYTMNLQTMILEPARLYPQIQESEFIRKSLPDLIFLINANLEIVSRIRTRKHPKIL